MKLPFALVSVKPDLFLLVSFLGGFEPVIRLIVSQSSGLVDRYSSGSYQFLEVRKQTPPQQNPFLLDFLQVSWGATFEAP